MTRIVRVEHPGLFYFRESQSSETLIVQEGKNMVVSIYINLDTAAERRAAIEENFQAFAPDHWQLLRAPAISSTDVINLNIDGTLRHAEKACYLSHLAVIKSVAAQQQPVWIREDDSKLGKKSCGEVMRFVNQFSDQWDILFTDLTIANPGTMFSLFRLRRDIGSMCSQALPLSAIGNFAGAQSYIVNPKYSNILVERLTTDQLSTPFDIALRKVVLSPATRAFVLFPFVTTESVLTTPSSVQTSDGGGINQAWAAFRRLIWLERDISACEKELDRLLANQTDLDSKNFGRLMELMADPRLVHED
jgi:GR25 family glycosyltransferase involved in LPS biosynthesis